MNHPLPFEGFCEITLNESSNFIECDEEPTSFTVWFYRRENETTPLEEFISSIGINNFGWDEVSKQLFFKSKDEVVYSVGFTKIET
jgi:hypothetical protein